MNTLNEKRIKETTSDIITDGKKLAHELYDDGLKRMDMVQKDVQIYTDELLEHVRERPLKSVLIAGGIGFLLAALLKK